MSYTHCFNCLFFIIVSCSFLSLSQFVVCKSNPSQSHQKQTRLQNAEKKNIPLHHGDAPMSSAPLSTPLTLDDEAITIVGRCSTYYYYQVDFPFACRDLVVSVVPKTGDKLVNGSPVIYVSKHTMYPKSTDLAWSESDSTPNHVRISHWDPESAPGMYYIAVLAQCGDSTAATASSGSTSFSIVAKASDPASDSSDILLYPELVTNQGLVANGYQYYRFCLESCANVTVTLTNCMDNNVCPEAYSYPELLISRNIITPTIYDYSFKLASFERRYITVPYSDPAARDANGFNPGSYYVGVFGWCTPDQYVLNSASDGPCSYVSNSTYNITIEVDYASNAATCDVENLLFPAEPTEYPLLTPGSTIHGHVDCFAYTYYTLIVPDPCYNVNLFLETTAEQGIKVAEFTVGKYPVVTPTLDNLEWTSYDWGNQNLTISAWDPNFDGGSVCGPNGNSTCVLYVGVYGYCVANESTGIDFSLTPTLARAHAIFNTPQLQQRITPQAVAAYKFCAHDPQDVLVQLLTYTDVCSCPNSYTDLEFVVSKTNPAATDADSVWRVSHFDDQVRTVKALQLPAPADNGPGVNTRAGTYYLNVYGYCSSPSSCSDACTCAPCANLEAARFGVLVEYANPQLTLAQSYSSNMDKYMAAEAQSCAAAPRAAGQCSQVCEKPAVASSSDKNARLGRAAVIAIAVVCSFVAAVFIASTGVAIYFYRLKNSYQPSNTLCDEETVIIPIDEFNAVKEQSPESFSVGKGFEMTSTTENVMNTSGHGMRSI